MKLKKQTTIEFYTSTADMPILKFNEFQKNFIISTQIGSNVTHFNQHLRQLATIFEAGDKEKGIRIINNMSILFNNINNEANPSHYAFLPFIKNIFSKKKRSK